MHSMTLSLFTTEKEREREDFVSRTMQSAHCIQYRVKVIGKRRKEERVKVIQQRSFNNSYSANCAHN